MNKKILLAILTVFSLLIVSCEMDGVEYSRSVAGPVSPEDPGIEEPAKEEESMELQAIPVYPAYYFQSHGALWGIPETLQGLKHKEKIDVLEKFIDSYGNPATRKAPVKDFFTDDEYIFIKVQYYAQPEEEGADPVLHTEYFRQARGTETIEKIENVPVNTEQARINGVFDGFIIQAVDYQGERVSEIWNTYPAFITPQTPNGAGPFRYPAVLEAKRMVHGLLFATENELLFLPENRTSTNKVAENGRFWF